MKTFIVGVLIVLTACGDNGDGDDGGGGDGQAPKVTAAALTTPEDKAVTHAVAATDSDGDALTLTAGAPAHGAVVASQLSVTYTPNPDYNGADSFTVKVTDGKFTTEAKIDVNVTAVNDAPVAQANTFAANEDIALVVPADMLVANDTDVDADKLEVKAVSAPENGTVTLSDDKSKVTFTPALNFSGNGKFQYTITDGTAESTATVTLNVSDVNDLPIANADVATTAEDTAIDLHLEANDTDVENQNLRVTEVVGLDPAKGTATVSDAGLVTFTPAPNISGDVTFDYKVTDGPVADAVTGHVTVTVTAVNDLPNAVADAATTAEDAAVDIQASTLLANDSDVETPKADLRVTKVTIADATQGTVTLSDAGVVTFTPAANITGNVEFNYEVTDSDNGVGVGKVTVDVGGTPDAPDAKDDAFDVVEDTPTELALLVNDVDPDGTTPTVSAVAPIDPTKGSAALVEGVVTFTPAQNFNGTVEFEYTITDDALTDTARVTVTVTPVNDAPVAVPDTKQLEVGTLVISRAELLANDTDVDVGQTLAITTVTNEVNGTVTIGETNITFVAAPGVTEASFDYTITDGAAQATAKVTIAVGAAVCGSGAIVTPEACDDGNTLPGDGCNTTCGIEEGFTCTDEPSVCTEIQLATFSFKNPDGTDSRGNEQTFAADGATPAPGLASIPVISRGSLVTPIEATGAFSARGWPTAATSDPNKANSYFSFTVTPATGFSGKLRALEFDEKRSGTGIRQWVIRSSLDGFVADVAPPVSVPDDEEFRHHRILLGPAFANSTDPVEFRFFAEGAEGPGSTWRLDNIEILGFTTAVAP